MTRPLGALVLLTCQQWLPDCSRIHPKVHESKPRNQACSTLVAEPDDRILLCAICWALASEPPPSLLGTAPLHTTGYRPLQAFARTAVALDFHRGKALQVCVALIAFLPGRQPRPDCRFAPSESCPAPQSTSAVSVSHQPLAGIATGSRKRCIRLITCSVFTICGVEAVTCFFAGHR